MEGTATERLANFPKHLNFGRVPRIGRIAIDGLHPRAEHVIDWFHIAMRFTVLKQIAKSLAIPDPNSDDPADHSGPASVLSIDRRPLAQSARQGVDSAGIHVASEW
jgi:hypothetical protein